MPCFPRHRPDVCRPDIVARRASFPGRQPMGEISQFIAMPFDLTEDGLVAGEPFKCASPASAIERAKGYWQVLGHSGAVAFIRTGYPDARITVLRTFGSVPDRLPE
jgi:hypothetical protein